MATILLLLYCTLWPIGVMEKELRRWRLLFQPRRKRAGCWSPEERHPWGNAKFPTDEDIRRMMGRAVGFCGHHKHRRNGSGD